MEIEIRSHHQWLNEIRPNHLGASEYAALEGASPYVSKLELYLIKIGKVEAPNLDDNKRVFWGSILEPAIATGCEIIYDIKLINPNKYYVSDRCSYMGATPDRLVVNDDGVPIMGAEIKNIDYLVYKKWKEEGLPKHIEFQCRQNMECTGLKEWLVLPLIGGNDDDKLIVYHDEDIALRMIKNINEFKKCVDEKTPPDVSSGDAPLFKTIYPEIKKDSVVHLEDDEKFNDLCQQLQIAKEFIKIYEGERDLVKAQLTQIMEDNQVAVGSKFTITHKDHPKKGFTVEPSTSRRLTLKLNKTTGEK